MFSLFLAIVLVFVVMILSGVMSIKCTYKDRKPGDPYFSVNVTTDKK